MKKLCVMSIFAAFAFLAGCGGQVIREWTISSQPSGALVEVSGKEVGRTPVTIQFTYYGEYEVILSKEGYETLTTSVKLNPPWYQYPVIDFFAETSAFTFHDTRQSDHVLEKTKLPSPADLVDRANDMKNRTVGGN